MPCRTGAPTGISDPRHGEWRSLSPGDLPGGFCWSRAARAAGRLIGLCGSAGLDELQRVALVLAGPDVQVWEGPGDPPGELLDSGAFGPVMPGQDQADPPGLG